MRIQLMITCLADVFRPAAGIATVEVLRRLGHEVVFPERQTCCGQPLYNSGFAEMARQQARHTIEVFGGDDPVVTPSGSCAAMVKREYVELLHDDPRWHQRAIDLAGRTHEFTDFLVNQLQVTDVGAVYRGRVAYHFACHLRMLDQSQEARQLIEQIDGAEYVALEHADQCCGFGGSFAVRYPHISTAMVDDKVACLDRCEADCLVSTDAGCLMNIGGRLHRMGNSVEVLHIAELLNRRA
jgi:L-lactate dehydrogenase complex protein LldE